MSRQILIFFPFFPIFQIRCRLFPEDFTFQAGIHFYIDHVGSGRMGTWAAEDRKVLGQNSMPDLLRRKHEVGQGRKSGAVLRGR